MIYIIGAITKKNMSQNDAVMMKVLTACIIEYSNN